MCGKKLVAQQRPMLALDRLAQVSHNAGKTYGNLSAAQGTKITKAHAAQRENCGNEASLYVGGDPRKL